ncbi:MAG: Stp1/IreP family PP2C-type Ser/Thr phosphatase [Eubacteriales bacterium]|nr:Stp1/IreP family PP2C-type Ser/Thr phosphatase [Eubacteriales bacterium]MDD3350222.1 Stp1/IreP family PP2C-type Ser/Thr phosphatase [Eubacteriales bacterium]
MHQRACATDKGRERMTNEDFILCSGTEDLYVVADGVGGHNSGEIASRMAVEYIDAYSKKNPIRNVLDEKALMEYFSACLEGINQLILRQSVQGGKNAGMATTVVLAYLTEKDKAYVVNIGDSRAYLIRDEHLLQITEDHTYVNELLKQGSITKAEAKNHPERNMITRAIGGEEKLIPDFYTFDVYPGDRILLCSDGLYNEVSSEEIRGLAQEPRTVDEFVKELVRRANLYGGKDNISVVCIQVMQQKKENVNE